MSPLLQIDGLGVEIVTRRGVLKAIDDLSLAIDAGEILGVVGASGAGQSRARPPRRRRRAPPAPGSPRGASCSTAAASTISKRTSCARSGDAASGPCSRTR